MKTVHQNTFRFLSKLRFTIVKQHYLLEQFLTFLCTQIKILFTFLIIKDSFLSHLLVLIQKRKNIEFENNLEITLATFIFLDIELIVEIRYSLI